MGTFNIAQRIDVRETNPNIDALYGPYESVEAACSAIPRSRRAIGRTVAIMETGGAVEYWWKAGIEDENLIVKVMEAVPHLEYTEEYPQGTVLHADLGAPLSVTVRFTSQSYGQCTLTVYRDGAVLKSIKANKGIIMVDLGVPPSEGTSTYTITGVDALTIPAEESLSFRAVIGGAKITSDFQDILDAGINTNSSIVITYSASTADTSKTIKVLGELINAQGRTVLTHTNQGSGSTPYTLSGQQWEMGVIQNPGVYTLRFYSYTGNSPSDISGDNVTAQVSYNFTLMDAGTFSMFSPTTEISTDTNTAIIVPFRIYSGSNMTLQAHGQILDNNGDVVENYELNRSVQSNVLNYWSLGKLKPEGNYTIKMWATTVGGEASPSGTNYVLIPTAIARYVPNYEINRNGLMAEFLAEGRSNNNDSDTQGVWQNSVAGSPLYFQLVDLNYNTNGWKHVDESIPDSDPTGEMMLKFSGDSYGRLKQRAGIAPQASDPDYNIMGNLPSSANDGFTAEVIFRTRCIGELSSKVITSHNGKDTNTAGFSANFEKVTVGSNDSQVILDVAEEEWIHATMVIDKTIHTNVDDTQDYAPRKLMTLYINGSACASAIITDNMTFTNNGPTILNAAINPSSNLIDYFGACEIKAIRFYNRPLYASEVVNNYIASIYGEERQSEIAGRNGDVLPIVRFININDSHPQNPLPDGCSLVNFATLNQMTEKAQQKKRYVCARILYQENSESEVTEWSRCIIQTQGTSTLAFPVKNYKIRLFDNPDNPDGSNQYKHKYKTTAFADKGWRPENVFTLKCDYMEAAHLNNTPSCEFYNDMIDSLVADGTIKDGWNEEHTVYTYSQDERTPARRDDNFDAIKGFPCLVYYYESEADFEMGNGTYVGSYMFNLDKAANSLGFDAPAMLDEDGETPIEGLSPREGEDQVENICQSFEGVANGSDTAGCFFSYEDWKTSYYYTYLDIAYARYVEQGGQLNKIAFCEYYIDLHPDEQYRDASQDSSTEFSDGGYLMGKDAYIAAASPYEDEYDYFASDFEMRYDWDDLEEGGEEFWGNDEWGLKRMIDWVSAASETAGTQEDEFRANFENFFYLKYVLIYYLQMMVFGQVDNAGKNSMWDTWDGTHWAPRPYDLDTMAGLDNTGFEVINPDAELLRELSPFMAYNNTTGTTSYSEDVSELANIRYRAYNTRTSKFWRAFAISFATEIKNMYKHLRDSGIYSIENIMDKFLGKTSDIIGEAYYNRDMATKFYKLSDIETFITRMHGNRVQRFKAWMSKRIIYCDTLFDYTSPTLSLNNNIILRSDALESGSTISLSVGIKVYSPQYVRIDVGSGYDAKVEAYCSPDAEYIDPITAERMEGTLFTIPLAAGDKEIQISGGGNIREIVNLGALKPKSLTLNYAKKITSLDLSYSTKLLALSLASNTYLQTLDCRGAVQLGTDASGAQLDLSNCVNLKYVYLDNTKLTSVVFPVGGSVKEVSLRNTAITALSLDSLHFLTSVDVTNCTKIINYSITNCPKIESITANELPLVNVSITDCAGLESISLQSDNSISTINIARCPSIQTLDFRNNRSASLSVIDLTTLYSLESLDISGSTVETVKFPRNESATSSEPWGDNFHTFTLTGSSIKYVQYGETSSAGVDMSQLTGLNTISFNNCQAVENILNLNYTGYCGNLFNACTHLIRVTGTITCIGSASSLFASCYALNNISGVTFNFAECTSLYGAFYRCPWVTYAEVKRVLDACGNSLTNISLLCYDKGYGVTYGNSDSAYTNLPAQFFANCGYVTSMSAAFYAAQLRAIPESAFKTAGGAPGLQRCTNLNIAFATNYNLTSIPSNIIKLLPAAQNISGLFQADSGITNTITSTFFVPTEGTSPITNINGMFYGCSGLNIDMTNMVNLLAPLVNLTYAALLFANCTKCVGTVPEGFFASNTRLVNIAGCFMGTRIVGTPLSGSIFRVNGDTTTVFNSLTNISGLFQSCTALITVPNSNLFAGASNVTSAGAVYQQAPTGGNVLLSGVFSECTGIATFGKDLFKTMPKLQNISGFFYNCTGLVSQAGGGFDADILSTHTNLTNVSNLFRGCTNLSINSVPSLFEASKSKITIAAGVFMGCTSISDFNMALFQNMTRLTDASNIFNGCTTLGTSMSGCNMFDGCTSLQTVQGAFYGCTGITGSIPASLFNSCRGTLTNVSQMFRGCTDLNGTIETGNEDTVPTDLVGSQLGLLAECFKLTTASQMFYGCARLTGKIPWDMFWTQNVERLYTSLTDISYLFYDCAFNQPVEVDNENYLFHPDMFIKLIALTTMEGLLANPSNAIHTWPANYPVHPNAFDGQYFLTNIKEIFNRCNGLGGAIPNRWFNNSISRIVDAYGAFAYTRITDVGTTFLRASVDTANTTLRYASRMFYNCTAMTGSLPAMNRSSAFSRIDYSNPDRGYNGYAYNDTNAANYSTFSGGWIQNMNY